MGGSAATEGEPAARGTRAGRETPRACPPAPEGALAVAKAHGTENDFVLVPDPGGTIDVGPETVRALCDRRAGIGGDGLIRVVPCAAIEEGQAAHAAGATWFMDYRNADGSLAEMCGNGVRAFAAYLAHSGLARLGDGEEILVGTRAGAVRVVREGDLYAVTLGPWSLPGGQAAVACGEDVEVAVAGDRVVLPGLRVTTGNPHVVVALPDAGRLARLDLTTPPTVSPAPPDGANVEFVVPGHGVDASAEPMGHLRMRVHERGVGETRSCGTGTVAAALAARVWAGPGAPRTWLVDVPGGRLRVRLPAGDLVRGDDVELAGPAVIVADGVVDPAWLALVSR